MSLGLGTLLLLSRLLAVSRYHTVRIVRHDSVTASKTPSISLVEQASEFGYFIATRSVGLVLFPNPTTSVIVYRSGNRRHDAVLCKPSLEASIRSAIATSLTPPRHPEPHKLTGPPFHFQHLAMEITPSVKLLGTELAKLIFLPALLVTL